MSIINYDNEIGTISKPPRLTAVTDYSMWKLRFKSFVYFNDYNLWISITRGPHKPEIQEAGGTRMIPLDPERYSEQDIRQIEKDMKAYGVLTMALPNEIYHNFKECKSAKELWDAMEMRYEGSSELKESKRDRLKKQYELFEYIKGENLSEQINRFTLLISELKCLNVDYKESDICKKLLGSLPYKWHVQVMIIKRTGGVGSMSLEELIGVLQSYEIDMQTENKEEQPKSNYGCALVSNQSCLPENQTMYFHNQMPQQYVNQHVNQLPVQNLQMQSFNSSYLNQPSGSNQVQNSQTKQIPEEKSILYNAFIASYEAFMAGSLTQAEFARDDLEQIHPDDLEEMDIKWQMAMITLRAKKFFKRTGRNNFRNEQGDRVGIDKTKVKCFNCN